MDLPIDSNIFKGLPLLCTLLDVYGVINIAILVMIIINLVINY